MTAFTLILIGISLGITTSATRNSPPIRHKSRYSVARTIRFTRSL